MTEQIKPIEYKYEAYLDEGQLRIKSFGTAKSGKSYGNGKNVADFVITKIKEGAIEYSQIKIDEDVLNSYNKKAIGLTSPKIFFKDEYYDRLANYLTKAFGHKTREQEEMLSKIN